MKNTSDAGQVAKAKKMQEMAEQEQEKDLKHLLDDPAFRRVIWVWLSDLSPMSGIFCGEDTHLMAYKSGKQDFANRMTAELAGASEEKYNLMRHEAALKQENEDE